MDVTDLCRKIMNTMKEGLVLIGPDGRILMVNDGVERLTGYGKNEIVGMECTIFDCEECDVARSNGMDRWCSLFAHERIDMMRVVLTRKDGSRFAAMKNASLMRNESGAILGAVETIMDLTEIEEKDRKIQELTRLLSSEEPLPGMVGASIAMKRVYELTRLFAQNVLPVLLLGESGTGKELVARAIHKLSRRKQRAFVELNCAALNESLLENELFGHARGAYTGAHREKRGRLEAAHGGSLFLDEIGDMPLSLQAKLLRVLENKRFERLGDVKSIQVDIRIIAATNKDLDRLVRKGQFREDLLHRINVMSIELPALRERKEDLPQLVDYLLKGMESGDTGRVRGVSPETMAVLMAYRWPGNVRELKNVLDYALAVAQSDLIMPVHLPARLKAPSKPLCRADEEMCRHIDADERQALLAALNQAGGNKSRAAAILGVNRNTVLNRMRKYGIDLQKRIVPYSNHG